MDKSQSEEDLKFAEFAMDAIKLNESSSRDQIINSLKF